MENNIEKKEWQKVFLEAGTKEVGLDLSIMIPVVSSLLTEARQQVITGIREMVTERLRNFANTPILDRKNGYEELADFLKALNKLS